MKPLSTATLAVAVLGLTGLTSAAHAATIWSGNFYRSTQPENQMAPTDVAGVVAEDNWTNIPVVNNDSPDLGASVASNDGTAPLFVTVTRIGSGSLEAFRNPYNPDNGGDENMLAGYLKDDAFNVDITGLAVGTYDFYFYTTPSENPNAETKEISLEGTSYFADIWRPGTTFTEPYQRATATDADSATQGNHYVLFEDVAVLGTTDITRATFTEIDPAVFNTLSGFQVVEIPEPASIALMGLGGLLLLPRRKRA